MDSSFSAESCTAFRAGAVSVYPDLNQLVITGRAVRIEPRLMAVLVALAAATGSTVKRRDLLERIWPEDGADEALTLAVSRLRRALGAHSALIETVPKLGYRLTSAIETITAQTPEIAHVASKRHSAMRFALIAATLVLGFWIGAYGAVWAHRDDFARANAHVETSLN